MFRRYFASHIFYSQRLSCCQPVHQYIKQEYARTCLIAYESQPKEVHQDGWGRVGALFISCSCPSIFRAPIFSGTQYENSRFRTTLLHTIRDIGMSISACNLDLNFIMYCRRARSRRNSPPSNTQAARSHATPLSLYTSLACTRP